MRSHSYSRHMYGLEIDGRSRWTVGKGGEAASRGNLSRTKAGTRWLVSLQVAMISIWGRCLFEVIPRVGWARTGLWRASRIFFCCGARYER